MQHSRSSPLRVGVLASGRGSNLQAVLDAVDGGRLAATVAVVISDCETAPALERARRAGVPAVYLAPGPRRSRLSEQAERAYVECLERHEVEAVLLAGFMRIVRRPLLEAFRGALINVHPSLLPAFPGLDAPGQALRHGVKVTGATVHFVDSEIDQGPILCQRAVPVEENDSRDTLADRILVVEHELVVEALRRLAAGDVRIDGRRVRYTGDVTRSPRGNLRGGVPR